MSVWRLLDLCLDGRWPPWLALAALSTWALLPFALKARALRPGLLIAMLCCAAGAVAGAATLAASSRSTLIRELLAPSRYGFVELGIYEYRRFAALAALFALVSWPPLLLVALRHAASRDGGSVVAAATRRFAALIPVVALLALAACTVVLYQGLIGPHPHSLADLSIVEGIRARYDEGLPDIGMPSAAWWTVLGTTGSVAALGAWLARRAKPERAAVLGSLAIFIAGLAAFAATRGVAADAARPLPLRLPGQELFEDAPAIQDCAHDSLGVDMSEVVVRAAGQIVVRSSNVPDANGLREELVKVRELLVLLQFAHVSRIRFTIAPQRPLAELRPLFAAARAAGFTSFTATRRAPAAAFATRTLGEVQYQPRACGTRFDPDAAPSTGTWSEWLHATDVPARRE